MAVSDTPHRLVYDGNGSATDPYEVTFSYTNPSDVKLLVGGVETDRFTVSPDGVRTLDIVEPGTEVVVYRITPLSQETDFPPNTTPAATSVEVSVDKLTRAAQEQKSELGNALRDPGGGYDVPPETDVFWYRNAAGNVVSRTAAQVASAVRDELNIESGAVAGTGTLTCADAAARALLEPQFEGQKLTQLDDGSEWVSTGTSAGDWEISGTGTLTCVDAAARALLVPHFVGQYLVQLDNGSEWTSTGTSAGDWTERILDENDFESDSAVNAPTQQSVAARINAGLIVAARNQAALSNRAAKRGKARGGVPVTEIVENDWSSFAGWTAIQGVLGTSFAKDGSNPAIYSTYPGSSENSGMYKTIDIPGGSGKRAMFVAEVYIPNDTTTETSTNFHLALGWGLFSAPAAYGDQITFGVQANGDIGRMTDTQSTFTKLFSFDTPNSGSRWYTIVGYVDDDRVDFGIRRQDSYNWAGTVGEYRWLRMERSSPQCENGGDIECFFIAFRDTRGSSGLKLGRLWVSDNLEAPATSDLRDIGLSPVVPIGGSSIIAPTGDAESMQLFIPRDYSHNAGADLVMFAHGTSGDSEIISSVLETVHFVSDLSDVYGYMVACPDLLSAGGNTISWGEEGSISALGDWYDWIVDRFAINNVYLVGASMGGVVSLNAIHNGKVRGIQGWYGIYPAASMQSLYFDDNRADMAAIYGLPTDFSATPAQVAAAVAGYDPLVASREQWGGISMRGSHSNSDVVINSAGNIIALSDHALPTVREFGLLVGTGAHGDPSLTDTTDFTDFIERTK